VPITLPGTYRDVDSGIIFYVESDGRHVSAISSEGKILWSREPLQMRIFHCIEHTLRAAFSLAKQARFSSYIQLVAVRDILDLKTGDFTFGGQD
jgi:hypothetical protein